LCLSPRLKNGDHVGFRIDAEDLGNSLERFRLAPCEASFNAIEGPERDPDRGGYLAAPEPHGQSDQLSG